MSITTAVSLNEGDAIDYVILDSPNTGRFMALSLCGGDLRIIPTLPKAVELRDKLNQMIEEFENGN